MTLSARSLFSGHVNSIELNHSSTPISIIRIPFTSLNFSYKFRGEVSIFNLPNFILQAISAKEIERIYAPSSIFFKALEEKVGLLLNASITAQVSKITIRRIQVKHARQYHFKLVY